MATELASNEYNGNRQIIFIYPYEYHQVIHIDQQITLNKSKAD